MEMARIRFLSAVNWTEFAPFYEKVTQKQWEKRFLPTTLTALAIPQESLAYTGCKHEMTCLAYRTLTVTVPTLG